MEARMTGAQFASARQLISAWLWSTALWLLLPGAAYPSAVSPLYARGYTVIPEPQNVQLRDTDFQFDNGWRLEVGEGVKPDDVAVESLKGQLAQRYGLSLAARGRG